MFSKRNDLENTKILDKLNRIAESKDHQIIQKNGQRVYEPCSSIILSPPKGSEIFIGNLPHDFYEDEILQLFEEIGPVYNIRLMMDFFGRNRGFGFLQYYMQQHAFAAINRLNGVRIRKNTRLAVSLSVDNRRLFVGNIPRDKTYSEIDEALREYVDGIKTVIMYAEPDNPLRNRGFVFVEFDSHREAAIARRQLCPGNLNLWDQTVFVDWAEPIPVVNPNEWGTISNLYVSNLPVNMSVDQLKKFIFSVIDKECILKVHKINNYAFVHFTSRNYAELGLTKLSGCKIGGYIIEVEWARPPTYSKQHRNLSLPDNYCRSVPPATRKLVHRSIAVRSNKRNSLDSSGSSSASISIDFAGLSIQTRAQ